MESIKLPDGPNLEFYTVVEKKPEHGEQVIFCIKFGKYCSVIRGYYKAFKTAPGRFVSETHGSHVESNVIYWTKAHYDL